MDVYVEKGDKRVFACAVEWQGWCRGGRDEASALEALLAYAPRYARALKGTRLGFSAPKDVSELRVIERLAGGATTDFGAPGAIPSVADRPFHDPDLRRGRAILRASWRAFDAAVAAAKGKVLAKGPRGGGRALDEIVEHVIEADLGYIVALGGRRPTIEGTASDRLEAVHSAMLETIAASQRGELPERGPRGGKRWKARYGIRRSAWHWLDHAWEIADRSA